MLKGLLCPHMAEAPITIEVCQTCKDRCMSLPMLKALVANAREKTVDRYSVTEILNPPLLVYLARGNDYFSSPFGLVWAIFGTAVHNILEAHGADDDRFVVEKKFEVPLCGVTLSGKVDLYDKQEKTLWDYKTNKEYSVTKMLEGDFGTYSMQLNMYRAFCFPEAEKLMLENIIKDWSMNSMHMPVEDIEVPMMPIDTTKRLTEEMLKVHLFCRDNPDKIPPCSDEDRWFPKSPRSKNYGVPIRCRDYCAVNTVCPQYKEFKDAKENKHT